MPLPRPTRPFVHESLTEQTAAPIAQETHRLPPTQYKPSDTFMFKPRPDITAYELAELMRVFFNGILIHHAVFEKLDDKSKRHFEHRKII